MRPEEAFGARLDRRRPGGRGVHDPPGLRQGAAEDLRQDSALPAAGAAARKGRRALETLPHRHGILLPAAGGGRINIDNFRSRDWTPALRAAGLDHRRIYDMRHTFATWSLAAGMSIFTLARRMGTSVQVIDATYGHLARDADGHDRELLDAYDGVIGHVVGTISAEETSEGNTAA